MIKQLSVIIFAVALLWTAAAPAAHGQAGQDFSPERGVVDLIGDDSPAGEQRVTLQGVWEFYWKRLLEPADLTNDGVKPAYIEVPSSWKSLAAPGNTGYGYATYRLRIHVPASEIGKSKALQIRSIGSAYRIWIDGKEKPGLGRVGTSRTEEVPQSHNNLVFLQVESQTVDIVIQTSNYSFREGGIDGEVVYGDPEALIPTILRSMFSDIFIIGGFSLIGLYHLVIYGMRRKDTATLLLGLVFLAFASRTLFIDGYISTLLLHINSWEQLVKYEYMSEIVGFLLLVLLMRRMYPGETNRYMVYLSYALSALLSVYVLFTPARVYTETMMPQTIAKAAVLLYFLFYIGFKAAKRRREGAFINLVSILIMIAAVINDALYWARLAATVQLLSIAFIVFLLAQAVTVSFRYMRLSERNDSLVTELGTMNATLELQVADRTRRLQEINEELSEARELRSKMLANIAHDLGTPLAGVQTYLRLMEADKLPEGGPKPFRQLIDKTDFIGRLVQFELSKLESRELPFRFERIAAAEWVREVCGKLEADLSQRGFTLRTGRVMTSFGGKEAFITVDRFRMLQALQNYIDNAVKFSQGKSDIITLNAYISGKEDKNGKGGTSRELVVEIVDYGSGTDEADMHRLFQRFYKKREGNEQGSGLGLAIVQGIIEQHRGIAGGRGNPEGGSIFFLKLPAE